jgi:curved DNA-binding protein CbpA
VDKYYRVLDLELGASPLEVKEAYRMLAKVWHPDRFANDVKMQLKAQERMGRINEAYDRLKDYAPPSSSSQDRGAATEEPGEPKRTRKREGERSEPRPGKRQGHSATDDRGENRSSPGSERRQERPHERRTEPLHPEDDGENFDSVGFEDVIFGDDDDTATSPPPHHATSARPHPGTTQNQGVLQKPKGAKSSRLMIIIFLLIVNPVILLNSPDDNDKNNINSYNERRLAFVSLMVIINGVFGVAYFCLPWVESNMEKHKRPGH